MKWGGGAGLKDPFTMPEWNEKQWICKAWLDSQYSHVQFYPFLKTSIINTSEYTVQLFFSYHVHQVEENKMSESIAFQ